MKKAKHQMDLIGNPYHVDEKHNLVFDTEYYYAIHLVNYPRPKWCELLVFASTELLVHGKHSASLE